MMKSKSLGLSHDTGQPHDILLAGVSSLGDGQKSRSQTRIVPSPSQVFYLPVKLLSSAPQNCSRVIPFWSAQSTGMHLPSKSSPAIPLPKSLKPLVVYTLA